MKNRKRKAYWKKCVLDYAHIYVENTRDNKRQEYVQQGDKCKEALCIRKYTMNDNFKWTPENTQKIRDLNNGLRELYRKTYDRMLEIKKGLDAQIAAGVTAFEKYRIYASLDFSIPEGLSKIEEKLWEDMCEFSNFWGSILGLSWEDEEIKSFEKQMLIDELSWNEYPFGVSVLDDTYICFFMHDIFNHNETFSLEDAIRMKPEDFSCDIEIKFDRQ
ncbi:MAG: hypothetical protein IJQ86_03930 [Spirochaetia bacterium]|nr:hypothetical protein [Spirochaetia bacterium]